MLERVQNVIRCGSYSKKKGMKTVSTRNRIVDRY